MISDGSLRTCWCWAIYQQPKVGKQQHSQSTCCSALALRIVYKNTTSRLLMVTHLILGFHVFMWHEDLSILKKMFDTIVMEMFFWKSFFGFWFTLCVLQSHKNLKCHSSKGIWRCKKPHLSLLKYAFIMPLYNTKSNFSTVLSSHWFLFLNENISLRIFS